MRPRILLLFAFVALLGAAMIVPPALAASSEVKLEIAEHCYFADWPCWNVKGNNPEDIRQIQPFTITQGGMVTFEDNEARYPTDVLWKGTAPSCTSGVPVTSPTKTNWSGTCTFADAGDYEFESQELFNDGTFNYTRYEVVVVGTPKAKTTPLDELSSAAYKARDVSYIRMWACARPGDPRPDLPKHPPFNFRWHDASDTRDPAEVMIGEGVEFDEHGRASQTQRLGPAELEALLEAESPVV